MLCRQVLPDSNGVEQIYIIKNEPPEASNVEDASDPTMEPEEVDVKEEPSSDDDEEQSTNDAKVPAVDRNFGMLDVIIKEEPDVEQHDDDDDDDDDRKSEEPSSSAKVGRGKAKRVSYREDTDSDTSDTSIYDSDSEEERKRARKKVGSSQGSSSDQPQQFPRTIIERAPRTKIKTDDLPASRKSILKRFVCHYCPKKFSTQYNLDRHEQHHENHMPAEKKVHRNKNLCYICQQDNETRNKLNEHLCIHADLLPYTCTECENPIQLNSVRLLNKHYQLHKVLETGIIKCMHCPATFHSLSGCQQHEKGHIEGDKLKEAEALAVEESKKLNVKIVFVDGLKRYECDFCGKSYSLLATLRRHINSHTMEKVYMCKTCGKIFNKASSLSLHEKVHSDVKPYKCEICGKAFKEVIRLVQHKRIHTGEKPFTCSCGLGFRKKFRLSEHQKRCILPEDNTPTVCRFCQASFASHPEMITHVEQAHTGGKKETKCQYCPAKFRRPMQLILHERRHQIPGLISCDQCNRIFKLQSELDKHVAVHANDGTSFMCDTCGKTFPHIVNLRLHKRIHSDKRPYVCDLCSKPFYDCTTMKRHRLTHYNSKSKNFIPDLPPVESNVAEVATATATAGDEEEDEEDEEEVIDEDIGLDEEEDEIDDIGVEASSGQMATGESSGGGQRPIMEMISLEEYQRRKQQAEIEIL